MQLFTSAYQLGLLQCREYANNITIYEIRHFTFKRAVNYFLDFSFLCRPIWGNATVSTFPHVLV